MKGGATQPYRKFGVIVYIGVIQPWGLRLVAQGGGVLGMDANMPNTTQRNLGKTHVLLLRWNG